MPAFAFLLAARQARLASLAAVIPTDAAAYRERARFWLILARQARPPPLP